LLPASAEDRDFILNGVKDGFKLSVIHGPHLPVDRDNYSSAFRFRSAVEKQIKLEIELRNYIVTKTKPVIISSIGAIEKPNGGILIIHDASLPTGISLNSYTTDTSCSYTDLRHALQLIKCNNYLGKVDLKSAYRSIKCHNSDHSLTGLQWTLTGDNLPTYMYDAKLPFGHTKSLKIFQQLSASVCSIMKCTYNVTCIACLDDFLVIADSFSECQRGIRLLIHILRELGFNISWNKIDGPSQSLTFLGIVINTCSLSLAMHVKF
jgi:hypothetical protein